MAVGCCDKKSYNFILLQISNVVFTNFSGPHYLYMYSVVICHCFLHLS